MGRLRLYGVSVVDVLYLTAMGVALVFGHYDTVVDFGMSLFALLVLLVDGYETGQLTDQVNSPRDAGFLVGLTLPVLGIWLGLATRTRAELAAFFALTAGFFLLVAVRETVVVGLTPVELVLEGYASLVAVYLVLGAASDAIDRFQSALVVIAVGVYVGRNIVWWTSVALDRVRGDTRTG